MSLTARAATHQIVRRRRARYKYQNPLELYLPPHRWSPLFRKQDRGYYYLAARSPLGTRQYEVVRETVAIALLTSTYRNNKHKTESEETISIAEVAGQTIGQITGEFVDGQTIGHLNGEFVDGQTIGHLTGEFVDGQTIGHLIGEFVDGQTIGHLIQIPTVRVLRGTTVVRMYTCTADSLEYPI
jgi:hypothetical protein